MVRQVVYAGGVSPDWFTVYPTEMVFIECELCVDIVADCSHLFKILDICMYYIKIFIDTRRYIFGMK